MDKSGSKVPFLTAAPSLTPGTTPANPGAAAVAAITLGAATWSCARATKFLRANKAAHLIANAYFFSWVKRKPAPRYQQNKRASEPSEPHRSSAWPAKPWMVRLSTQAVEYLCAASRAAVFSPSGGEVLKKSS
jgi:hypothetical protein